MYMNRLLIVLVALLAGPWLVRAVPSKVGDVYQIATKADLEWFAGLVNGTLSGVAQDPGARATLTADIAWNERVLDDKGQLANDGKDLAAWTPIGLTGEGAYYGTFDGAGHTIRGLYINEPDADYRGLFGRTSAYATIARVRVADSYIRGNESVAGIVGYNYGSVIACSFDGVVKGSDYIGGIVGRNNEEATVADCYSLATVEGESYSDLGGVAGRNNSVVRNCYFLKRDNLAGIGNGRGQATAREAAAFASGEVCWALNGERADTTWVQALAGDAVDAAPVPSAEAGKRVYPARLYEGNATATDLYINPSGITPSAGANPLVVVETEGFTPAETAINLVVKAGNTYTCRNLTLVDADFYTPVAFTAAKAKYSRVPEVYAMGTDGWETICLPFDATLYADGQPLLPVAVTANGGYWLRLLVDFQYPSTLLFSSYQTNEGKRIMAGVPYIIALPGSRFGAESVEGKAITAEGTNVAVVTEPKAVAAGSYLSFKGAFAASQYGYGYQLNSENGSGGLGDKFALMEGNGSVAPFRCVVASSLTNVGDLPPHLSIGNGDNLGITSTTNPQAASALKVYGTAGKLVIETTEATPVAVYQPSGRMVWSGQVAGKREIPVARGIYIVNGRKIAL